MKNLTRVIEHVERVMSRGLDKPPKREVKPKQPKVHAWRAAEGKSALSARSMKVNVSLNPLEISALWVPNQSRVELTIGCERQLYRADIATKSLRKAQSIIKANGAENTFVGLVGRLKGNQIIEAGLVANAKAAKAEE